MSTTKFQRQLFESTDRLTSALALNCCQFGCLIRDVPIAEYGLENSDWMAELKKVAPNLKLRDIVMPGTHDSASYTIPKAKFFAAVSLTQNLDVHGQLSMGMRYLDVRIATGSSGETAIFHGCVEGGLFSTILDQINEFLEHHVGEFIFLDLVQEYGRDFSEAKRVQMFQDIKSTFGDKMYTTNNCQQLLDTKLQNLNGKQLCVLLNNRIYGFEVDGTTYDENHIAETFGIFSAQRWMRSHWHNTRECSQLLEWNLEEVKTQGTNRRVFLTNQFVLTPGVGGAQDILSLLVGQVSLRPVSFAIKLYRKDVLDDFMREHAEEKWNIVMLDYCDLVPALVSFLIGLNFKSKISIQKAAVHAGSGESIDVTDKIQSFIKRQKVLYLTNISKDLELNFSEGKLTIAYKLGDSYHILDVDWDESSEVVVGEYSQNEGVLVHIDAQNQPKGCYSGGQIMNDRAAAAENGTILEYVAATEGNVEFSIVR